MSLLGKFIKTTIHIATVPVDILKDAATLGSQLTDEGDPYTERKLRRLRKDLKEITKEVDSL